MRNITIWILGLFPWTLHAQFICPPCNMFCDTLSFSEAGICPHCNMQLVEQVVTEETSDTLLHNLQKEAEDEGLGMHIVSILSDLYGPRLLGTSNYIKALNWAKEQLESWGADEVSFHKFDRNHRGWELNSFDVTMSAPTYNKIQAYPAAFTNSTDGEVEGEVLYLDHWQSIYEYEGKLKGKIVLLGDTYRPASNKFEPFAQRFSTEQLNQAVENPDPNHRVLGYLSRRSINQAIRGSYNRREAMAPFFEFARQEGALALVEASYLPYGILHVDGNTHFPSYIHKDDINPIACFVFSNEHFGRLKRLLDQGITPKIKLHLDATFVEDEANNQNLLATIEGQDPALKEESIIIGGHFDSWHAGTGAVDNGSGVAIMMEAFRLLKALDLEMKRSVKLALWGGEEQIFAGSFGYVEDIVGNIENGELKEEALKIAAYFNLDNGAGKIRGIYTMGNDKVIPPLQEILQSFTGDNYLTLQYANQTDHELFDRLNIPAFQFIQDPLDYISALHHTNLDAYEYVPENDIRESAILVAYLVYRLANEEQPLPRKRFNSPKPSRTGNTLFEIAGYPDAQQVQLIGTFNNWNLFGTPMYKTDTGWACKLDLPPGEYLYKFYIDNNFIADPVTPEEELKKDGKGHGGLTIRVVEEKNGK